MNLPDSREVSRKDTTPVTFCLACNALGEYWKLSAVRDAFQPILYIYQENQRTQPYYPLVISVGNYTRKQSSWVLNRVAIMLWEEKQTLDYTLDWWWRTPSNVGAGPLLVAFRVKGIYELSHGY